MRLSLHMTVLVFLGVHQEASQQRKHLYLREQGIFSSCIAATDLYGICLIPQHTEHILIGGIIIGYISS